MESKAHKDLKEKSKEWLKDEHGFKPEEIVTEYYSEGYRIDVVGENEDKCVAVECGKITGSEDHAAQKVKHLEKEFDDYKRLGFEHTEYSRSERPEYLKELLESETVAAIQVEELDKREMKVQRRSTSLQHTIPSDWSSIIGLESQVRTVSTLNYDDRRGPHISIWPKTSSPENEEQGQKTFASILAKNFSRDAKALIRELDRARVHELVDMVADEIIHQENESGEIEKDPETRIEREFGDTRKTIIEELTGE